MQFHKCGTSSLFMGEMMDKIPNHVAIIMDGNGRWAKKRGLPRNFGHKQGSAAVRKVCEAAYDQGVKYLTIYAFSTENWSRPKDEVDALMNILRNYLKDAIKESTENNMRVRIIGDKTALAPDLQESIDKLEKVSANNTGLNFQIALNYGGRNEIVRAVNRAIRNSELSSDGAKELTEADICAALDTAEIPDPDLLIRTSGEQRLSNFLLWQLAYAEFYFTDTLWPDFDAKELKKALEYYAGRDRRFGGIKEEK